MIDFQIHGPVLLAGPKQKLLLWRRWLWEAGKVRWLESLGGGRPRRLRTTRPPLATSYRVLQDPRLCGETSLAHRRLGRCICRTRDVTMSNDTLFASSQRSCRLTAWHSPVASTVIHIDQ